MKKGRLGFVLSIRVSGHAAARWKELLKYLDEEDEDNEIPAVRPREPSQAVVSREEACSHLIKK